MKEKKENEEKKDDRKTGFKINYNLISYNEKISNIDKRK